MDGSPKELAFLPPGTGRVDSRVDFLDQLGSFQKLLGPIERKHEVAVYLDVVHAVIRRDETKFGKGLTEFLQDRVRVLHRLELISAWHAIPDCNTRHLPRDGFGK